MDANSYHLLSKVVCRDCPGNHAMPLASCKLLNLQQKNRGNYVCKMPKGRSDLSLSRMFQPHLHKYFNRNLIFISHTINLFYYTPSFCPKYVAFFTCQFVFFLSCVFDKCNPVHKGTMRFIYTRALP